MYYYRLGENILFSDLHYDYLEETTETEAKAAEGIIYFLKNTEPIKSLRSFCVTDPSLLFSEEGLNFIIKQDFKNHNLPEWILDRIHSRRVMSLNTGYSHWKDALSWKKRSKWRINVVGLGDVGGILVTGLRLLGGDCVSVIGIYDIDSKKLQRWQHEVNQILSPSEGSCFPEVIAIERENLFDCDMFVFCVSLGVPAVGNEEKDVRLAQFEGNSRIISNYAKEARKKGFKGIFSVVSDPVDLLCKSALLASSTNDDGQMDCKGLAPEQIRGYGLGVMHARAAYYAKQNSDTLQYITEGRVFGPHGEGLVVADSILNYNDEISNMLAEKVRKANIEIRGTGFKPYIAPALSSGALSLLASIKGDWHYSATYMGGVYMGARNRITASGVEVEKLELPEKLADRIKITYERLGSFI